ncbi:MAG: hypothetical protein HRT56_05050, partial [Coraliomargarita sp.]|nr:hypothetical protein [Coraliomargarita sp.]
PEPEPEMEPEIDVEVDVIAGMDDVMVDDDDWDTNQIEVEPEELEARALESKADEVEPETPDEEPQVVDAPKAVSKSEEFAPPVDEAPGAAGADLFGDSVPSAPAKRRSRTKKNDSVLTVSVLIGIGNKPFLRGSGGGLSWDRGIQMDFQEIGKWRWVAPEDLEGPVELQVFRNDEDPDRKGRHTLQPGQKLEVSPVF